MSHRSVRAWRHVVLGLLLALPAFGWAQSYMGKVCLISTVTVRHEGPVPQYFAAEFDVTNLGGNTYSVAGSVPTAPGEEPMVATGLATVVAGYLHMNLATTQAHADGWMDTGINRTRLNLATMTGTFYEIGHDYNTVTRVFDQTRYSAGTVQLSLTACQR